MAGRPTAVTPASVPGATVPPAPTLRLLPLGGPRTKFGVTERERGGACRQKAARALVRSSILPVEADAVQFHAMVDEAEAHALGDRLLELLELGIDELEHAAGLDVDQMVVMRLG